MSLTCDDSCPETAYPYCENGETTSFTNGCGHTCNVCESCTPMTIERTVGCYCVGAQQYLEYQLCDAATGACGSTRTKELFNFAGGTWDCAELDPLYHTCLRRMTDEEACEYYCQYEGGESVVTARCDYY
ncbi:MAG: hypothetical protein IJ660_06595 [Alphaproteobacteria bacterium]|nr:hypothetical protein [Alphaproteobacteria bacterium]